MCSMFKESEVKSNDVPDIFFSMAHKIYLTNFRDLESDVFIDLLLKSR